MSSQSFVRAEECEIAVIGGNFRLATGIDKLPAFLARDPDDLTDYYCSTKMRRDESYLEIAQMTLNHEQRRCIEDYGLWRQSRVVYRPRHNNG